MATAAEVNNTVECSICSETFSDPRSLPCIHSYCFKCINNWCKDKQPGEKAACPLCRHEFSIPEGGMNNLPKNSFIGKLLVINGIASSPDNEVKMCDSCSADDDAATTNYDRTAIVLCLDCQQNLCSSCSKVHSKLKNSSIHSVLSLSELTSGGEELYASYPSTLCDKHPTKSVDMYCADCKTTICTLCCIKDHNPHKCSEIAEVADQFRAGLAQNVETLTSLVSAFDEKLRAVRSKKTGYLEQVRRVETEIEERTDHLKSMIDDGKRKLIAELNELRANHEKQLDNFAAEVTHSKSLMESLIKYTNELMKKGTAGDLVHQAESLRRRTETLSLIDHKDWHKLSATNVSLKQNSANLNATIIGDVIDDGVLPLTPTLIHTQNEEAHVAAIAALNNQLFVTRDGVARVSIFNATSFRLQLHLSPAELGTCLLGLAACPANKCLYISDNNNKCVHRIELAIDDADRLIKWQVASEPRGLSVNGALNVLVVCKSKLIQEYTSSGSIVREISHYDSIWQAVELRSSVMVVTCNVGSAHHGLVKVSTGGKIMKRYGNNNGCGVGQMKDPHGLVVTETGYILVADEDNHRILVVDPLLTEARQLPLPTVDPALRYPRALCYDQSRSQLYVGEGYDNGKRLLIFHNVANVHALFSN